MREKEGKRRWGRCRKRGGEKLFYLLFVCLTCTNVHVCFLFFDEPLLGCLGYRIFLLSFLFLILSSPSPHPAQLRLHLSPAIKAPTPADLPQRTDVGKSDGVERKEIQEEGDNAGNVLYERELVAMGVNLICRDAPRQYLHITPMLTHITGSDIGDNRAEGASDIGADPQD